MMAPAPPVGMAGKPDAAPLTGPSDDPGTPVALKGPTPIGARLGVGANWTVFVYGHGDHNLSPALLADFLEMNAARLNDSLRVVFLADWNAAARVPSGEGGNFPAGAFWYQIVGDASKAQVVGAEDELNLDNPSVMARAIELAFKAYPAERYGLILWDHGGSWFGGFGGDTDNETHDPRPMSVDAVMGSVKRGLAAAGLGGARRLDLLGFDTCVMAGVEVIASFRDTAKLFIGNAELDYGDGFDYQATLTWLAEHPGASIDEIARAEANAWDEHHREASAEDYLFRSHAAFDTVKFEDFLGASQALVTAARASKPAAVASALYATVPAYFSGETRDSQTPRLRDVGNILGRLSGSSEPGLAAAAARALAAARKAKLAGASGASRAEQLGLHVFAGPIAQLTDQQLLAYPRLADPWNRATGWADLLSATRAARSMEKPQQKGEVVAAPVPTLQNPPAVNLQVSGNDLGMMVAVLVQQNPQDDMQLLVNGNIDAALVSASGTFTVRWSGRRHVIDTRPEPLLVTAQPWLYTLQDERLTLSFYSIDGLLVAGDQQIPVSLLATPEGVAGAVVLQNPPVVLTFEDVAASIEGQAMFVPLVTTYDDRKKKFEDIPSKFGVYLPPEGALKVVQQPVPAGGYAMLIDVEDVWGNFNLQFYPIILSQGIQ